MHRWTNNASSPHPAGLVVGLTLVTLLPACEREGRADLDPAPTAQEVAEQPADASVASRREQTERAISNVRDVAVTIATDAWPGDPLVRREVTPLKLTVENGGDVPVNVQFEAMHLADERGETYAALPPWKVEGKVEEREAVPGLRFEPTFEHEDYELQPTYDSVFDEEYVLWETDRGYDPAYYEHYWSYWAAREVELPTSEMLSKALPEGVVRPKGKASGFVYFEKVDPDDERVAFEMRLRNARTQERFGRVRIPLVVTPSD